MKRKQSFRIAIAMILAIAMVATASLAVFARQSVNNNTNKPVVPGSGYWGAGGFVYNEGWEGVTSVDVDTDSYKNRETAEVVEKVNSGKITEFEEVLKELPKFKGKTDIESMPTTEGYDVNMKLYDRITDFYDLKYHKGSSNTDVKVGDDISVTIPDCEGMTGSDLMIIVIDSKTGELYLVPPKWFDSNTGTLEFIVPCIGPYCVVHKIPIVVRNVDPDLYPNKELGKIIGQLPDDELFECYDFLKITEAENLSKLEVDDNVFIDPKDYKSVIALSDIAIRISADNYSYDLTSRFKANLFRGNDKVDWERILEYSGVSFDKDEILKDDKLLTEIEPIKLKDCFVYHIDAVTREVSIIYEPTVRWDTYENLTKEKKEDLSQDAIQYFDVDDIDPQNVEETRLKVKNEEDTSLIQPVYADTEIKDSALDEDDVCLIINGDEYLGMGPFLLFVPKDDPFPWWILLVIAAICIYIYYRKRKKDKEQAA